MQGSSRFVYLNTRVTLLANQLLGQEELAGLVSADPEHEQAILERAGLSDLPDRDPASFEQLDNVLLGRLLLELQLIVRPLNGAARDFFLYWGRRFELASLKALLRARMAQQPPEIIRTSLGRMPHSSLPLDELLQTEDTEELMRRLEHTEYGEVARQARRMLAGRRDLFAVDAALDRQFYTGLRNRADAVAAEGGTGLRRLVGTLLDQINLVWLLRYRFAYQLPPAQTYYLLLPAGNRLSHQALMTLARLESMEELLHKLPEPLATILSGVSDTTEVFDRLQWATWRAAERMLRRVRFTLSRPFAYLLLRERDLLAVQGALKGKALQFEPALINFAVNLSEPAHV